MAPSLLTVLEFGPEARKPLYDSYCISNIANTILSLLNVKNSGLELPNDVLEGINSEVENVVLFVFDGLGYNEWERQNGKGFFGAMQSGGRVTPITTVFPSTTSTALTTIATGLTPQEHSLIEWYLYVQEIDMVIQTLPFSPMGAHESDLLLSAADPSLLFEGETIFSRLRREGIAVDSVIPKHVASRSYSKLAYGQSKIHGYESVSDLSVILRKTLESRAGPSLTYVYYDKVDTVEHSYGPNTEEAEQEHGQEHTLSGHSGSWTHSEYDKKHAHAQRYTPFQELPGEQRKGKQNSPMGRPKGCLSEGKR